MAASFPKITLYRLDGSCAMVPHILLTHLGIPFTSVPMRPSTGQAATGRFYEAADGSFTSDEYLKIHPKGYVPALKIEEEDGTTTTVTENPAVLVFIASLALEKGDDGVKGILGRTGVERAKVAEWLAWCSGTLHGGGYAAFWKPHRFVGEGSDQATEAARNIVVNQGKVNIEASYAYIEERLALANDGSDKWFAVGKGLTVADFNLYIFWRWGYWLGINMEEKFPSYAALMKRIEGMDEVRKVLAVEGQEPRFG